MKKVKFIGKTHLISQIIEGKGEKYFETKDIRYKQEILIKRPILISSLQLKM